MRWSAILDAVFPPQCASCNAFGSGLCGACVPAGTPLRIGLPGLTVRALAPYEDTVRTAVLALKDGRRDVAEALGRAIAPLIAPGSCLVPVPTTVARLRVRGVDGVALVARHAARGAGAEMLVALEQRRGDAQRGRSRTQRLAARGRFVCRASIAGRRVTLVDDVCTTGATLRDCAAAVRAAGGIVEDAVVAAVALREAGTATTATKSGQPWGGPTLS